MALPGFSKCRCVMLCKPGNRECGSAPTALRSDVPEYAGMLETGFHLDSLQRAQSFTTYESHVLFALRFMIDCNISGGNWVELKSGAYKLLAAGNALLVMRTMST